MKKKPFFKLIKGTKPQEPEEIKLTIRTITVKEEAAHGRYNQGFAPLKRLVTDEPKNEKILPFPKKRED